MASKRTYGDACGIARALDIVGERWALMVVRELLLGPKRFTDLRDGLPHLSADVLSQRLRDLQDSGVVSRRTLPPPAASQIYELTAKGAALEPVLTALGRWGGANAAPPQEGAAMSSDAYVLSLRTLFSGDLAGDLDVSVDLRLGGLPFHAVVRGGVLDAGRGEAVEPTVTIEAEAGAFLAVVRGRRKLAEAERTGDVVVRGDRRAAKRFLGLFPLPAAAGAATAA